MLYGFLDTRNTTAFPFNPNPDKYKPAATGGTAASYELDVTDQSFRFPQTWRTNVGVDRRLPWGLVGTLDYIYNRDLNAPVYVNANLPAAAGRLYSASTTGRGGPSTTPGATPAPGITTALPTCAAAGQVGPCFQRLNNAPGNQITSDYVIKNQSQNHSWNISGALTKPMRNGLTFKGGFNYGGSWSVVEPSSTAGSSWGRRTRSCSIRTTRRSPTRRTLLGKRVFLAATYSKQYFRWGATTFSAFYDGHTNPAIFSNGSSYVFSGDANGDGVSGNDLIYIPRDTSEMNFKPLTVSGRTFSAAEQAAAFDQYIQADDYLSSHRGQYAERNAVFLPIVNRIDLSLTQDVFGKVGNTRHSGQIRLDMTNFGNMLNHNWGVGMRLINGQILTSPSADAQGRLTYNMQTLSGQLLTTPQQTNAGLSDVYVVMLSFRYTFQ